MALFAVVDWSPSRPVVRAVTSQLGKHLVEHTNVPFNVNPGQHIDTAYYALRPEAAAG
jgi:hypothetical protein